MPPNIRHAWSLKVPVNHFPQIHVTQNLKMLLWSSLNLIDSVIALLWVTFCTAWFGLLRMTDVYLPITRLRPSRACLSLNPAAPKYQLHPSVVLLSFKAHKTDLFQVHLLVFIFFRQKLMYGSTAQASHAHEDLPYCATVILMHTTCSLLCAHVSCLLSCSTLPFDFLSPSTPCFSLFTSSLGLVSLTMQRA